MRRPVLKYLGLAETTTLRCMSAAALWIIAGATADAAGPDRYVGHAATVTCHSFTTALALAPKNGDARIVVGSALSWVYGFLSATHDATLEPETVESDLLRDVTEDVVNEWLKLDCQRRPHQTIRQATRRFIGSILVNRNQKGR